MLKLMDGLGLVVTVAMAIVMVMAMVDEYRSVAIIGSKSEEMYEHQNK